MSAISGKFVFSKSAHMASLPIECLHVLIYDGGDLHPRLVVVLLLRPNVLPQEGVRLDVERARFLGREERGRCLNEGATHK